MYFHMVKDQSEVSAMLGRFKEIYRKQPKWSEQTPIGSSMVLILMILLFQFSTLSKTKNKDFY